MYLEDRRQYVAININFRGEMTWALTNWGERNRQIPWRSQACSLGCFPPRSPQQGNWIKLREFIQGAENAPWCLGGEGIANHWPAGVTIHVGVGEPPWKEWKSKAKCNTPNSEAKEVSSSRNVSCWETCLEFGWSLHTPRSPHQKLHFGHGLPVGYFTLMAIS